jgi:hypothetical protein
MRWCKIMKVAYRCKSCGNEIIISDGSIPDCCGKPMKQIPMDACTQPAHAEHARPMRSDEPCDDGRAG